MSAGFTWANSSTTERIGEAVEHVASGACRFDCDYWADASTLIKIGAVFPIGTKRPDFVCGFKDGSLGIFEAKGTTGTAGGLSGALTDGKTLIAGITATDPIKYRVVVGVALGGEFTKVVLLDPPEPDANAKPTNLTAEMVRKAARAMRQPTVGVVRERPADKRAVLEPPLQPPAKIETIFRGPDGEIKLTNQFKEEKRHGWLEKKE